jgi:hypothetical protein
MKSSALVKAFLVFNLILCCVITGFGVKLFQDREMIKARTLLLQEASRDLADTLNFGQQQAWEDEAAGEGTLRITAPESSDGLDGYIAQLNSLESVAQTRVEQLSEVYETLLTRREELAVSREELRQRTAERDQTRADVAALETELTESQSTLADARAEVSSVRRTNQSLTRQVDDLDRQIANLDNQISSTRDQLALRTGERDRVQKLLDACLRPRDEEDPDLAWKGQTASILAVEPEWNFVVLNKGEVDILPMFLDAEIKRGDQRIGKVRVMQVENKVAIAEIITEELAPDTFPQAGDTLIF